MAALSDQDRNRLSAFLIQSFDDDSAGDMEAFARNFLHNGKVWDVLADHFPEASPSALRAAMTDAYGQWSRTR